MNVKTQSWSRIRSWYEDWAKSGIQVQVMLTLLDWIRDEKISDEWFPAFKQPATEVFATTSHATLILSDKKDFKHGENMLAITPMGEKVCFTYLRLDGSKDKMVKIVSVKDATETLRLFLAYKYGIYRKPKKTPEVAEAK